MADKKHIDGLLFDDDDDAETPPDEAPVISSESNVNSAAYPPPLLVAPVAAVQLPPSLSAPAGVIPQSAGVTPQSAGVTPQSAGVTPQSAGVTPQSAGVTPQSARASAAGAGRRLPQLSEAIESGRITEDEAELFRHSLALAKQKLQQDPKLIPKDVIFQHLVENLGEGRANELVRAIQPPRAPSAPQSHAANAAPPSRPGMVLFQQVHGGNGPAARREANVPNPLTVNSALPVNQNGRFESHAVASAVVKPVSGPDVTKERKKRVSKASDQPGAAAAKKRVQKAAGMAIEIKEPSETDVKKIEGGLVPVSIDEYQTAGHHRSATGHGKRGDGDVASTLLQSVLPSDLVETEEMDARNGRRDAVSAGLPSVGSSLLGGGLFSSQRNYAPASWDQDVIMTKSKILHMVDSMTADSSKIAIDEDAVRYVALAAENMLKDIIEASIISSRRRRNQTAIQQFEKIQHLLQLPGHEKGVSIPEHGHNLGMGWSVDVGRRTLDDGLVFVQNYDGKLADLKESIKKDLMKYDEERRLSGKKRQNPGPGQGAGPLEDETWWTQDAIAEKNGALSWPEIAMAQFKLKVAEEYELGPFKQRRRKNTGRDDGTAGDMEVIPAADVVPTKAVSSSAVAANSTEKSNMSKTGTVEWETMRCPLYSKDGDVVSKVDVLRNLNKKSKLRSGGGYYSEQLGSSLYRAKLNLPSHFA